MSFITKQKCGKKESDIYRHLAVWQSKEAFGPPRCCVKENAAPLLSCYYCVYLRGFTKKKKKKNHLPSVGDVWVEICSKQKPLNACWTSWIMHYFLWLSKKCISVAVQVLLACSAMRAYFNTQEAKQRILSCGRCNWRTLHSCFLCLYHMFSILIRI